MQSTTFSKFRNNARHYFDQVEKGEIIQIYRYGKPVAFLMPMEKKILSRWKDTKPLKLPGVSLSMALRQERDENR